MLLPNLSECLQMSIANFSCTQAPFLDLSTPAPFIASAATRLRNPVNKVPHACKQRHCERCNGWFGVAGWLGLEIPAGSYGQRI
jgi:hypothetical protein